METDIQKFTIDTDRSTERNTTMRIIIFTRSDNDAYRLVLASSGCDSLLYKTSVQATYTAYVLSCIALATLSSMAARTLLMAHHVSLD